MIIIQNLTSSSKLFNVSVKHTAPAKKKAKDNAEFT